MRRINLTSARSILLPLLASAVMLPACGGNPPPPPEAPPPPPPAVTAAPAPAPAPAPPPTPAPTPVAAEAPPAEAPMPHRGHHGMLELFGLGLDGLELTPEQKTTVSAIKADMATHAEAPKEPREKLEADVIAGVNAGKIDHAKTDADIKAMSAAVAATAPAMQDDMNRLYKALTPEQRKKLIETMREKGKEMHEHEGMAGGMGGMGGMGHGERMGPKDKGDTGPGAPMHEHEHENKGGGHMEHEHEGAGPEGVLGKLTEDLGLTPEQKDKLRTKIAAHMETQHAAMKAKMTTIMKHMDAVGTAFESDKFDAKKAGVGADAPDMLKAIATAKVQFVETVLSVLTPEQRPKLAAHLQAHAGQME